MTSGELATVYIFIQACSWMSQRSKVFVAMRVLRTPLLTSPAISSFCDCAAIVFTIAINAVCGKKIKIKINDCYLLNLYLVVVSRTKSD